MSTHFRITRNNDIPIFLSLNTSLSKELIEVTPTTAEQRLSGFRIRSFGSVFFQIGLGKTTCRLCGCLNAAQKTANDWLGGNLAYGSKSFTKTFGIIWIFAHFLPIISSTWILLRIYKVCSLYSFNQYYHNMIFFSQVIIFLIIFMRNWKQYFILQIAIS